MSENSEKQFRASMDWDLVLGPIPFEDESFNDNDEEFKSALKEARRRLLISIARKKVLQEAADGMYDGKTFKVSELLGKTQNRTKSRLITLSLEPFSPNEIPDRVKFYNSKINKIKFLVKGTKWVYEQRGECDESKFTGVHIHILAPKTKKYPNEIIRDLSMNLKVAKNFIHIIDVITEDADKYLLGEKQGSKKQLRQKYDAIMRSEFNLEKFYLK